MTKQRDAKISLHDILEAKRNCLEFTKGMNLKNEFKTRLTQR